MANIENLMLTEVFAGALRCGRGVGCVVLLMAVCISHAALGPSCATTARPVQIAKLLLRAGADREARTVDGETVLEYHTAKGRRGVATLIEIWDAVADAKDAAAEAAGLSDIGKNVFREVKPPPERPASLRKGVGA